MTQKYLNMKILRITVYTFQDICITSFAKSGNTGKVEAMESDDEHGSGSQKKLFFFL